jgi:hypothetical protein
MRILLDECLPRRLVRELRNHDVRTVPEMGWAGKRNGELIELMKGQFDIFITVDQGIPYQQNLSYTEVVIVLLSAESNRFETLRPLMPKAQETLETAQAGDLIRVSA